MSAPPKTVLAATPEEADAIRRAVRELAARIGVRLEHAPGLARLLADPRVSDPIYDIPRPITEETVSRWVAESIAAGERGECLMTVTLDEAGEVAGYSRIVVWPDRASAEIAGAKRADRQNSGSGGAGVAQATALMFETLGVRLIGLTAALDNIRSAKAIDAAGYVRMGERESVRPDGSIRRSLYWELTRDAWRRMRRA